MTLPGPWILLVNGHLVDRHHYVSTQAEDGTLPPPASPEVVAAKLEIAATADYLRELRADPARQKRLAEAHLEESRRLQAENEVAWADYMKEHGA